MASHRSATAGPAKHGRSASRRGGGFVFLGERLAPPTDADHHHHDEHTGPGRPPEDPLPCYRFNEGLAPAYDDGECPHCRRYLTLRCPYIDDFLDQIDPD